MFTNDKIPVAQEPLMITPLPPPRWLGAEFKSGILGSARSEIGYRAQSSWGRYWAQLVAVRPVNSLSGVLLE